MVADFSDAKDAMFGQLQGVIGDAVSIVGYTPKIVWQGIESTEKEPIDKFWCRISNAPALEKQKTFRADSGTTQKRRYNCTGILFIQIFVPLDKVENYQKGERLAELIKNAYRGKQTANGVFFRNVTIVPKDKELSWNRLDVISEYEYDEVN